MLLVLIKNCLVINKSIQSTQHPIKFVLIGQNTDCDLYLLFIICIIDQIKSAMYNYRLLILAQINVVYWHVVYVLYVLYCNSVISDKYREISVVNTVQKITCYSLYECDFINLLKLTIAIHPIQNENCVLNCYKLVLYLMVDI